MTTPPAGQTDWLVVIKTYITDAWAGFLALAPLEQLIIVVPTAAAVIGFIWGASKWFRGLGKKKARPALTKALCAKLPKKSANAGISVLVFELDGDDARASRTNGVETSTAEAFSGHAEIHRAEFTIALGKTGSREGRMKAARELVAHALEISGHDGALWGDVVLDRDVVNFVIQTRGVGAGGLSSHKLDDTLRLAPEALDGIGPLVAARLSAECAPAYQIGRYVADILTPTAERLERLLAAAPAWLTGDAKGQAWHDLAAALCTLGEQTGKNQPLERSIAAYREALKEWTRERAAFQWAMTQNNLGSALRTLGKRESGNARLEEAIVAYSEALKEWTREGSALNWAMTQANLGNALATLGERESGNARLEEAVAAYREALKERTRERDPAGWARTQNSLGDALRVLGERERGNARLEEAVIAFRDALKEWTRERVPLSWATAQNNLGNALCALGERETGSARLEEAVAAYREALKEWTRERVPLDWALTQNNLGTALQALGEREGGHARLEEAIIAYREALKERTRERVPLDWGMTQNNLGNAEMSFGDTLGGEAARARYEAALAAFELALEVFREARATAYVAITERNLARVRGKLGGT